MAATTTAQDSLSVFGEVLVQNGLANFAQMPRVNGWEVAAILFRWMPWRRRIVAEIVFEGSLFQGHLMALVVVRRLIDASLVPRAEGHVRNLVARSDVLSRHLVGLMAAQGATVLL